VLSSAQPDMADANGSQLRSAKELLELFQRSAPSSWVEYMLFLFNSPASEADVSQQLETIRETALEICSALTREYLWQREDFGLHIAKHEDGTAFLLGRTDFGDSVEDEWLIVYLLRKLSQKFPDLWIRVSDGADGEFLLIEAAEVLPQWLSPEIDTNRVWIQDDQLRIIRLSEGEEPSSRLSLSDALTALRTVPKSLMHSPLIEAEAFYRLEKYPAAIGQSTHHARASVPRRIAAILHNRPRIVSAAVEAFTARDPLLIKQVYAKPDRLSFPRNDCVTVSVKFSKLMFAQLQSDVHPPPRALLENVSSDQGGTNASGMEDADEAAVELGLKLTAGFELLQSRQVPEGEADWMAKQGAVLAGALSQLSHSQLPTNKDISEWPDVNRNDDRSWMDVDISDLDDVLQGGKSKRMATSGGTFGDQKAAEDLRKMVQRFEAFMNDESAGLDGAELHAMDQDDDEELTDEEEHDDSEEEDKEVSFDEEQFARMMREMMGLPPAPNQSVISNPPIEGRKPTKDEFEDNAEEGIEAVMAQTEAELKEHGALSLSTRTAPKTPKAMQGQPAQNVEEEDDDDESGDEEIDVDYGLAKNLLESLKSQGALAGPVGNIMGAMGLRLPRDADEDEEAEAADPSPK
jgi:hypothetical protein